MPAAVVGAIAVEADERHDRDAGAARRLARRGERLGAVVRPAVGDDRAHAAALHPAEHVGDRVALGGLVVVVQVGVEQRAGVDRGTGARQPTAGPAPGARAARASDALRSVPRQCCRRHMRALAAAHVLAVLRVGSPEVLEDADRAPPGAAATAAQVTNARLAALPLPTVEDCRASSAGARLVSGGRVSRAPELGRRRLRPFLGVWAAGDRITVSRPPSRGPLRPPWRERTGTEWRYCDTLPGRHMFVRGTRHCHPFPPLHQGAMPRGLRALRLVRAPRLALAHDRPAGPAARQRHRVAPSRARLARRGLQHRPRHARPALSRQRAGAGVRGRREGAGRGRPRGAGHRRRRRQHLHRLSLSRAHAATSSSGSACAPTSRPTTWSARAAPPPCPTCSSAARCSRPGPRTMCSRSASRSAAPRCISTTIRAC